MNKRDIRIRIGDLLDICRQCPLQDCKNCSTYKEIRKLGKIIAPEEKGVGGPKPKDNFTHQEYLLIKQETGLTDKEIAKKVGIKANRILYLKRKWGYKRGEHTKVKTR